MFEVRTVPSRVNFGRPLYFVVDQHDEPVSILFADERKARDHIGLLCARRLTVAIREGRVSFNQ